MTQLELEVLRIALEPYWPVFVESSNITYDMIVSKTLPTALCEKLVHYCRTARPEGWRTYPFNSSRVVGAAWRFDHQGVAVQFELAVNTDWIAV